METIVKDMFHGLCDFYTLVYGAPFPYDRDGCLVGSVPALLHRLRGGVVHGASVPADDVTAAGAHADDVTDDEGGNAAPPKSMLEAVFEALIRVVLYSAEESRIDAAEPEFYQDLACFKFDLGPPPERTQDSNAPGVMSPETYLGRVADACAGDPHPDAVLLYKYATGAERSRQLLAKLNKDMRPPTAADHQADVVALLQRVHDKPGDHLHRYYEIFMAPPAFGAASSYHLIGLPPSAKVGHLIRGYLAFSGWDTSSEVGVTLATLRRSYATPAAVVQSARGMAGEKLRFAGLDIPPVGSFGCPDFLFPGGKAVQELSRDVSTRYSVRELARARDAGKALADMDVRWALQTLRQTRPAALRHAATLRVSAKALLFGQDQASLAWRDEHAVNGVLRSVQAELLTLVDAVPGEPGTLAHTARLVDAVRRADHARDASAAAAAGAESPASAALNDDAAAFWARKAPPLPDPVRRPEEPLKKEHLNFVLVSFADLHLLLAAATGAWLNHGNSHDKFVKAAVNFVSTEVLQKEPFRTLWRQTALLQVLGAEAVTRAYKNGFFPTSARSDGNNFNVTKTRTHAKLSASAAKAAAEEADAEAAEVAGFVALPLGVKMSPAARAAVLEELRLGDTGVAGRRFEEWGLHVARQCGGDLGTLTPERAATLVTLVCLTAGLDLTQPGMVRAAELLRPLTSVGHAAPTELQHAHGVFMRHMASRMALYACDPGVVAPVTVVNVNHHRERQEAQYTDNLARRSNGSPPPDSPPDPADEAPTAAAAPSTDEPCSPTVPAHTRVVHKQVPFAPRPQRRRVLRVDVDAAEFSAELQPDKSLRVESRGFDWLYGAVVYGNGVCGLQPGDQVLRAQGKPALGKTAAMAMARLKSSARVKFTGERIELRVYRADDAARQRQAAHVAAMAAMVAMAELAEREGGVAADNTAPPGPEAPAKPAWAPALPNPAYQLTRGTVVTALKTRKFEDIATAEGRRRWADERFERARAAEDHLSEADAAALAAQRNLRAIRAAANTRRAVLAEGPSAGEGPMAHLWRATGIAVGALPSVAALHFHPGRVREDAERRRTKKRLMDKTLDGVENFVSGGGPRKPGDAQPLVVVGDWLAQRGRRTGSFPLAKFFKRLARRVVVVVAPEHNTTSLCGFCAAPVHHPTVGQRKTKRRRKKGRTKGRPFYGSVSCHNATCASHGRLQNRDVHAASNIAYRWLVDYLVGGRLGTVMRCCGSFLFFFPHQNTTPSAMVARTQAPSRPTCPRRPARRRRRRSACPCSGPSPSRARRWTSPRPPPRWPPPPPPPGSPRPRPPRPRRPLLARPPCRPPILRLARPGPCPRGPRLRRSWSPSSPLSRPRRPAAVARPPPPPRRRPRLGGSGASMALPTAPHRRSARGRRPSRPRYDVPVALPCVWRRCDGRGVT